MSPLETLASLVHASAADEWYVTDGATAVGPVGLELLGRGIDAGRVPLDAFVRHGSWGSWRLLSDLTEHDPSFDPRRSFRMLPAVHAPKPAPPPPPRETLPSIDIVLEDEPTPEPPRPARKTFEAATDLAEALMILLAATVEASGAEAALIHQASKDKAVVVCSHGPRMFEALGEITLPGDPALFAAQHGHTLHAEPVAGVGGRAIKTRLSKLGARVEAMFMVPLRVDGKLLAFVEVGRSTPFRATDVAAVERLVDALGAIVARSTWSREWKPASAASSAPAPKSVAAPSSPPKSVPAPKSIPAPSSPPRSVPPPKGTGTSKRLMTPRGTTPPKSVPPISVPPRPKRSS